MARRAISCREPESALAWVARAEWCFGKSPESSLLSARANRKLARWEAVREDLIQAKKLGASPQMIQLEDLLAKAQSGQLKDIEYRRNQLLLNPQGELEEICEAYVLGYLINKQFGEAMELLTSWSADFPDNPRPYFLMGTIYGERERTEEAITALRQAVDRDSNFFEARLALANALQETRKIKPAVAEFLVCRKIRNDPGIHFALANCYLTLGDPAAAEKELTSGVASFPDDFKLNLEISRFHMNDDPSSALIYAEKATRLMPRDSEAKYVLAQILLRLGRRDEAQQHLDYVPESNAAHARIQILKDEIATRPDDIKARYQIAGLELKYGSDSEGLRWLMSILQYDPANAEAIKALADYFEDHAAESSQFEELATQYREMALKDVN